MARGKKLDIFIGADIEKGWAEVQSPHKTKIVNKFQEPNKHFLVFQKEKRKGKIVTLVGEFYRPKEEQTALLKLLKKKIGCGGNIKNHWMEFQGELKEKIRPLLVEQEFRFKHGH